MQDTMTPIDIVPGECMNQYNELQRVLQDAFNQAANGKGKERHAGEEPFERQQICTINRWLRGSPVAGPLFQVVKKAVETPRLDTVAAIHELYGAINYAAAAIILLEEMQEPEIKETGFFDEGYVCPSCKKELHITDMECPRCGRKF